MSRNESSRGGSVVLDVILTLALLAGSAYGCYYVAQKGVKIDQTTTYYVPEPVEEPIIADPNALLFENTEVPNSETRMGSLILVNASTPCEPNEAGLVSLYNKKLDADSHSFSVRDADLLVQEPFADALIEMLNAFNAATEDDNILVNVGYRSMDAQKELYDKELEATGETTSDRVAQPGFSEFQTGWCVDFSIYDSGDYDGSGVYEWIDEHCAEYGIVLRYPSGKEDATQFQYQPWHYRYVGKPHALFMKQNNLVLEEYLQYVKDAHPYDGEHLKITDADGKVYEVYYYPADDGYDSTMVPIPSGKDYTISGTNTGGFIVTVDTGETGVPEDNAPAIDAEIPAEGDVPADPELSAEGEAPTENAAPAEEAGAEITPIDEPVA